MFRRLVVALVFILAANSAWSAEPLKIKGFYIGMTKEEALKVVRRDMVRGPEEFKVYGDSMSLYPGADSQILVRRYGNLTAEASYAALFFQKGILKFYQLMDIYFDAQQLDAPAFSEAILKSYPIKDVSCTASGSGKEAGECRGKGAAGEEVHILGGSLQVQQPIARPVPPPITPKFN